MWQLIKYHLLIPNGLSMWWCLQIIRITYVTLKQYLSCMKKICLNIAHSLMIQMSSKPININLANSTALSSAKLKEQARFSLSLITLSGQRPWKINLGSNLFRTVRPQIKQFSLRFILTFTLHQLLDTKQSSDSLLSFWLLNYSFSSFPE